MKGHDRTSKFNDIGSDNNYIELQKLSQVQNIINLLQELFLAFFSPHLALALPEIIARKTNPLQTIF